MAAFFRNPIAIFFSLSPMLPSGSIGSLRFFYVKTTNHKDKMARFTRNSEGLVFQNTVFIAALSTVKNEPIKIG